MKHLYLILIGILLPISIFSQSKRVERLISEGDVQLYKLEYIPQAFETFSQAYELEPQNVKAIFGKAKTGIYLANFLEHSHVLFDTIVDYYAAEIPNLENFYYFYGLSLKKRHRFDESILAYKKFLEQPNQDPKLVQEANDEITSSEVAKKIVKKKVGVTLALLPNPINVAPYESYSPIVTTSGKTMFFTSNRPETKKNKKKNAKKKVFTKENVFVTHISQDEDGKVTYSMPQAIKEFSSKSNNMSVKAVSPDESTLILFRGTYDNGYLLISNFNGKKWSKPKIMGRPFNVAPKTSQPSASFSPDGNTIYFSSNRSGGVGGFDIYQTTKIDDKKWGEATLLSSTINTPNDELAFYAHSDGKTFYLLSNGHNTIGGYDVFVTTLENGKFSVPENMGAPLNTVGDESDISMPSSAKLAYMSSNRKDGMYNIYVMSQRQVADGPTHVYQIEALSDGYEVRAFIDEHGITFHDVNMLQLEGLITDITSEKTVTNAEIMIKNLSTNERYSTAKAPDGTFSIPLPGGNNYELSFQAKGYMYVTHNLDLTAHTGYAEKFMNIQLTRTDPDSLYSLIVFFDFDKSDIREESLGELIKFKKFLDINPNYTVELHGHTDAIGSDQYNIGLSLRRCNSIAAWLVKNNIAKSRIKTIGYGKSKPIDTNETDAGRQRNRRVEFKIVKM